MPDALLDESVERFLSGCCDLRRVREIEADGSGAEARALWADLEASGFADALTSEAGGGAGLGLAEAGTIALASGRHALPSPLALTMAVRASMVASGIAPPPGAITIAPRAQEPGGAGIACTAVPYGLGADWLLASVGGEEWLLPTGLAARDRSGGHGSLCADLRWKDVPASAMRWRRTGPGAAQWLSIAAALTAGEMAGAMERITAMTVSYANDRSQFGKPIGKFQAIQQQVSVMAEQTFAARAAALFALSGSSWKVDPFRAAVAKSRAGEAASVVAAIGHAVHGAIGVTAECDLQMLTRRLHEWRGCYGGQGYWNRQLGTALIESSVPPIQFIQERAAAAGPASP
jgi:acyl-CoA dehydrogenase